LHKFDQAVLSRRHDLKETESFGVEGSELSWLKLTACLPNYKFQDLTGDIFIGKHQV